MTSSVDGDRIIVWQHRPRRFTIQAAVERARNLMVVPTRRLTDPRLVVLGNQKAGTSVVAAAIGEAIGERYRIDLPIERLAPTYLRHSVTGPRYPEALLHRSRNRVRAAVVKEPSLTFWWRELATQWPSAHVVFVVRHPLDNIRSILDRLGLLPVTAGGISTADRSVTLPFPWLHLARLEDAPLAEHPIATTLDDVVANLGRRWRLCAEAAAAGAEAGHTILRYEDFLDAPDRAMAALGLPDAPAAILDRPFQPRGANRDRDPADLLRPWVAELWPDIAPLAERLGYSADRKTAPIRRTPEPTKPPDLTTGTVHRDAPARPQADTGPSGVVEPIERARSSGKGAWT